MSRIIPRTLAITLLIASPGLAAGGYLATITSQAENDFVFLLVNNATC
jgi:hypothetical protein